MTTMVETEAPTSGRLKDLVWSYMALREWLPPHALTEAQTEEIAAYFRITPEMVQNFFAKIEPQEKPPTLPPRVPAMASEPGNGSRTLVMATTSTLPVAALTLLLRRVWEEGVNHLMPNEPPAFVQAFQEVMLWAINQPEVTGALQKPTKESLASGQ